MAQHVHSLPAAVTHIADTFIACSVHYDVYTALCMPINTCTARLFAYLRDRASAAACKLVFVSDANVCSGVAWTPRAPCTPSAQQQQQRIGVVWVNTHAPPLHMVQNNVSFLWVGPDAGMDDSSGAPFVRADVGPLSAWHSIRVAPHIAAVSNANSGPVMYRPDTLLPDETAIWREIAKAHAGPIVVLTYDSLFALLLSDCVKQQHRHCVLIPSASVSSDLLSNSMSIVYGNCFRDVDLLPNTLLVLWQLETTAYVDTGLYDRCAWTCYIGLAGTDAEEHYVGYMPATRLLLLNDL